MQEKKKIRSGMDGSQITGTASSYARKYALNGLFNIDDTKDADTDEFTKQTQQDDGEKKITKVQASALEESIKNNMFDVSGKDVEILEKFGYKNINEIKIKDYKHIVDEFLKLKGE